MDLRQLTALVMVADVGSVTKAARLLHLVQPAVTRQIHTLEEELGVPLFTRTRQGMIPTAAGEVMVDRARRALNELQRARAEIRPDPVGVTGVVTVGVLESVMDLVVDPLVAAVGERYPGIDLRFLAAYSGHLQQWLDNGDIDVSLLYNMASTQSLAIMPLLYETLWVVGPPTANLLPSRPVSWQAVLEQPLILPVAGHGLRALIEKARPPTPAPLRGVIETNSMFLQKRLVLSGRGWTVLPAVGAASDVRAGRLSGAPLRQPEISRTVALGLQRGTRTSPPVEAVAVEFARLARAFVASGDWPSATLVTDGG